MLTVFAGFFLAAQGQLNFQLLLATLVGVALIIGSACVFNNYLDRDIDRQMTRTKKRALVKGLIPVKNAIIFAAVIGAVGFGVLTIYTNFLTVVVGFVGFFDYIVLYGLTKRRSAYGTLVGTVAGATPIVAGYTAVTGHFGFVAALLFLILVFWQMAHFLAIALYRFKDYKQAHVPVWPVKKGTKSTKIHILIYILAFGISTLLLSFRLRSYFLLMIMFGLSTTWAWRGVQNYQNQNSSAWGRKMFLFSLIVISVFSLSLAVGSLTKNSILVLTIITHTLVALTSLIYASYLYLYPSKAKFNISYVLAGFSLISGSYLVGTANAKILGACLSGLLYISFIAFSILAAHRKLGVQKISGNDS